MKKILIAAMLLVTVFINSSANSYFSMGDSLRIPPRYSDGYYKVNVQAHFDAYADTWQLLMGYPDGVMVKLVSGISALDGMTVEYTDITGALQAYEAPLQVSAAYSTISSHIGIQGYWDYNQDNILESYGSVKWEAGTHDMFSLNLYLSPEFRKGWITMDGNISSGNDSRGPILSNVQFFKRCWVWIGYRPGDVTGNDRINIDDVTELIGYLLETVELDDFQKEAADVDRDGQVNIKDVTALIHYLLQGGRA